ncbi:MAG: hypothetical protein KY475_07405 [Planctomycetes bacterium]|nr:hypothetical protein [Planctomycetota bacterium]
MNRLWLHFLGLVLAGSFVGCTTDTEAPSGTATDAPAAAGAADAPDEGGEGQEEGSPTK